MVSPDRFTLRELLKGLSLEDLKELVYRLGLDWDDIPGETREAKARNLIIYFERRQTLADLAKVVDDFQRDPVYYHQQLVSRSRQNELNLLKKVRTFWIRGVLDKSLYTEARLALGLEAHPEAVARPWEELVQMPGQTTPQPLPPGTMIRQVYDEADGQLLILGAPGAGKTTLLLDLIRDLLARAFRSESHPLPVVFHLSSWAAKHPPLAAWLADELNKRYDVPRKTARGWVAEDRILPLLDGLDEVQAERRSACVEAINTFRQEHGLGPLVVCSRTAEYQALATRIEVTTAVLIQSLTREQVDGYLATLGEPVSGLRQALAKDEELSELADNPLMLSILLLTYQGQPAASLVETAAAACESDGSVSSVRTRVFAAYVARMFDRRGKDTHYRPDQTLHWLAWLAQEMMQQEQSIFFLEHLQPGWLPSRTAVWLYALTDRLGFGLVIGLTAGLLASLLAWLLFGQVGGLITGLTTGVLAGLFGGSSATPFGFRRQLGHYARDAILGWLVLGLVASTVYATYFNYGPVDGLSAGLIAGLVGGLAGLLTGRPSVRPRHISVVETLRWLPAKAISRATIGLVVGLSVGLVYGLFYGWELGFVTGIVYGFFGGLIYGILGGLVGGEVEAKMTPNQGIRRSFRSALFIGLGIGLMVALFCTLIGRPFYGLGYGMNIGVALGLAFGGYACLSHFALRLVLWRQGTVPWSYMRFLDYATERIFMRKVGGGYIFVHRLLQEYFASLRK